MNAIEPTPWTYAEDIMCSIAQATDDLTRFLSYWQNSVEPPALQNLVFFIDQNCDRLHEVKNLRWTFWQPRSDQWNQVKAWLKDPGTLEYFAGKMTKAPHLRKEMSEILVLAQRCAGTMPD